MTGDAEGAAKRLGGVEGDRKGSDVTTATEEREKEGEGEKTGYQDRKDRKDR